MRVTEWEFQWSSTAHERYNTDMNERAVTHVEASGFEITDEFGGSMLGAANNELAADNGIDVRCTKDQAEALRPVLEGIVGHAVTLHPFRGE